MGAPAVIAAAELGLALWEGLCELSAAYLAALVPALQATASEILVELVGEDGVANLAGIVELYETYNAGWVNLITEDILEGWIGLAEEDASLGEPIARMIANFGAQNFMAGAEEAITVIARLSPELQDAFLTSLRGLGEADSLIGNFFREFAEYLQRRIFADFLMIDAPLSLMEFLQNEAASAAMNLLLENVDASTVEPIPDIDYPSPTHLMDHQIIPGGPTPRMLQNPENDNDDDYNVNFKLELDNQSQHNLNIHQVQVHSGWLKKCIFHLEAGAEDMMHGRKVSDTATGCAGSVAWSIGEVGKILVVMYSVPYSHDLYSNWLAVGVFDPNPKNESCQHQMCNLADFYNKMYYEGEDGFARKDFYSNLDPVTFSRDGFTVEGSMDESHKTTIRIQIKED